MTVIQLQEVSRTYQIGEVKTHALKGVSLTVEEGEFSALVGPSGSGKTTLLQLMGCLDKPSSGSVTIKGQDISDLNANGRAELRRGTIGFVFQYFALIAGLTAYENVELPMLIAGINKKVRHPRTLELLNAVGLSDRAQHRPDQMSGGEQQRVAIARALATHPLLVLADEPTANLDSHNGQQVMEIMQRLNSETGTTFIFATHDPRVVPYAQRVVELQDGRITADRNNGQEVSSHEETAPELVYA